MNARQKTDRPIADQPRTKFAHHNGVAFNPWNSRDSRTVALFHSGGVTFLEAAKSAAPGRNYGHAHELVNRAQEAFSTVGLMDKVRGETIEFKRKEIVNIERRNAFSHR